jgi:hypothetical protein
MDNLHLQHPFKSGVLFIERCPPIPEELFGNSQLVSDWNIIMQATWGNSSKKPTAD